MPANASPLCAIRLAVRDTFIEVMDDACSNGGAPKKRSNSMARSVCGSKPACGKNGYSSFKDKTTVILRNLPYQLSCTALLEMLDGSALRGRYDLVYFPRDLTTPSRHGLGFAFVNLMDQDSVKKVFAAFDGLSFWPVSNLVTQKVCHVEWAKRQGLKANLKHFIRNSSILHPSVPADCQPMLFEEGMRVAVPAPRRTTRRAPPAPLQGGGRS